MKGHKKMEEEKKEVVNETSESVNEEKKEKKDVKVIINQFVEKHGKKKCIIGGAICGGVIVALILGLGLGLGLGGNKKAPIVSAEVWKTRADEISNMHIDGESGYVAPSKMTFTAKSVETFDYSDGAASNKIIDTTWVIDYDNFNVYGKSLRTHERGGDDDKIDAHSIDVNYTYENEFWFWVNESEGKAYTVAREGTEYRSMWHSVTTEEIAEYKAKPDSYFIEELVNPCVDAFEKQLDRKGDHTVDHFGSAAADTNISACAFAYPASSYFESYYDFMSGAKTQYISMGKFSGDYTADKDSLELRSSGSGNASLAYTAKTDADNAAWTEAITDCVKHLSASLKEELAYDNYNMTRFARAYKGTANLVKDVDVDMVFQYDQDIKYTASKIKLPEAKNLINSVE